jgi:DNA-binding transcriptional LysR family regulator
MRERCARRSAVRLGLTELDMRSALRQLGETLGAPLFTEIASGLTPTGQAQRLARARRAACGH